MLVFNHKNHSNFTGGNGPINYNVIVLKSFFILTKYIILINSFCSNIIYFQHLVIHLECADKLLHFYGTIMRTYPNFYLLAFQDHGNITYQPVCTILFHIVAHSKTINTKPVNLKIHCKI